MKNTKNRPHICVSNDSGACDPCASYLVRLGVKLGRVSVIPSPYAANRDAVKALMTACVGKNLTVRRVRKALAPFTARKRQAQAQASLIAKRGSMDATYRVWIKFARGASDLVIATDAPKGYREARASRKVRGDDKAPCHQGLFNDRSGKNKFNAVYHFLRSPVPR